MDKLTLVKFDNGKYGIKRNVKHFTEFLDMGVGSNGYWWHIPVHVVDYSQTRWKWRAERMLKKYKASINHVDIKEPLE